MWLHTFGVFGLRKNFKQFVITEEVESGERHTFFFHVGVKAFLNDIQIGRTLLQEIQQFAVLGELQDLRILMDATHQTAPVGVHIAEFTCFHGQMFHNIR